MAKGFMNKRALIDSANSTVVIVTGIAAFVLIFSLVASKTLIGQANYQKKVISEKRSALELLTSNAKAADTLNTSYKAFISTQQNVIGGDPSGIGPQDGNNAKIVLDALPSTYDFPALVTSLEKLLDSESVEIGTIGGTDDEVVQGENKTSATPEPVAMPFQISVTGDYKAIQAVVSRLERSIRPVQIQTMSLSGSQDKMSMSITAQTFYQPGKSLKITTKVVEQKAAKK